MYVRQTFVTRMGRDLHAPRLVVPGEAGIRKDAFPLVLHDVQRALGVVNTTVWNVNDEVTLKNIFGFRRNRVKEINDFDGTVLPLVAEITPSGLGWNSAIDQYTEEFQIQRKGNLITWIAGLYYEYSQPGTPQVIEGNDLGMNTLRRVGFRDSSNALFAHMDVDLSDLHSGLSASGGARYTRDQRQASLTLIDNTGACTPAQGGCSFNDDFGAATWDFSVQQKLKDTALTYIAVRKGYKSGGFNLPFPAPQYATFDPETVTDLEVGLKSDWEVGSMPLRTNLDAYRDWYRHIQLIQGVATPTSGLVCLVTNAADAKIYGFEAELTLIPVQDLQLTAFYSYTRAVYGKNTVYDNTNAGGSQFDNVLAPPPINKIPTFTLLNVHLDWNEIMHLPLDLTLFGTNMTDRRYITGGYPIYDSIGFSSSIWGEPRMYGASLRYRFGKQR
jgi:iron complex outermembrane receptor protein